MITSVATQKLGTEIPEIVTMRKKPSRNVPGLMAEMIPTGIPISAVSSTVSSPSSAVTGRRDRISGVTGRRFFSEMPKSPWMAFQAQSPYCTKNGRSSPNSSSRLAIACLFWSGDTSPKPVRAAFPGRRKSSQNSSSDIPNNMNGTAINRRAM